MIEMKYCAVVYLLSVYCGCSMCGFYSVIDICSLLLWMQCAVEYCHCFASHCWFDYCMWCFLNKLQMASFSSGVLLFS